MVLTEAHYRVALNIVHTMDDDKADSFSYGARQALSQEKCALRNPDTFVHMLSKPGVFKARRFTRTSRAQHHWFGKTALARSLLKLPHRPLPLLAGF